ncbi:MAG: RES family NAD+ phosphorylase [Thermoanaerobaculia bacterium]
MIAFRCTDPRFPFLWEATAQPEGRWHHAGGGPVQYLADTPHGAWAEFLRHEELRSAEDLEGVERALWAVEIPEPPHHEPELNPNTLTGGRQSWPACQREAERLRTEGAQGLKAPSAALKTGGATGICVDCGPRPGPSRDGKVLVLFGLQPALIGWPVVLQGRPPAELLSRVRHF